MSKAIYSYGIELIECECGVWRVNNDLDCWNHQQRTQLSIESLAQFNQSIRNLGYQLLKSLRLVK